MTTFYRFADQAAFVAAGGKIQSSEYTHGGIGYSVIGARYTQELADYVPELDENGEPIPFEPVFIGFLVNTTAPVEDWEAHRCEPSSPMRVFG